MPQLDDVVQDFEARTEGYVRNVVNAAREADRFGEQNSEAARSARQMGIAAQEAGERAARSQREAAEAAQRLARGEETVQRATQAAVRAQRDMQRASIAQARASDAAARAADEQGDQYRQLAREATLAAAAQRLAQLRAAGATEEHDRLLTHLQGRFGDLGRDGSAAFQMIGDGAKRSGMAMKVMSSGGVAPVIAALGALPWLASAAAAGITLGLGGALVGLGLKASAGSKAVKKEIDGLKKHIKSESKDLGKPFERTWMVIADAARDTFDELVPDLRAALAQLAPYASAFADDFIRSFEEFRPAIRDVAAAAGPLMNTLGNEMPRLMGRTADAISRIAKAADSEMFGRMIDGIGLAITHTSHFIAALSKLADAFYRFGPIAIAARNISNFGGALKTVSGQGDLASAAMTKFDAALVSYDLGASAAAGATSILASGMGGASGQVGTLGNTMKLASQTAEQLKASLDKLAGKTLNLRQATSAYQAAIDAANTSIQENGKRHGFATEKARQNEQALNTLATSAHAQAVAMRDSGKSAQQVTTYMEGARRKFISTAQQMGYTRSQAINLANKLFGVTKAANSIPPRKNTKVTAQTSAARAAINALIREMSARTINIGVNLLGGALGGGGRAAGGYVGYAGGGPVQGYPRGGMVRGPGSPTSDSIPAWLSNGEFVTKAAETARWRPLLEAINSGALSKAARLSSAKAGTQPIAPRPAPMRLTPAGGAQVTQIVHHYHIAGTVVAERQLVELARAGLAGRSVNNGGSNGTTTGRRP